MSSSSPRIAAGVKSKLRNPLLGGHRSKEPSKFQFDITIDRVVGGSAAEYSVKWCRGVKTATTRQFTAEPKNKDGVAVGDKLSLLCTLYRAKTTESRDFESKDSKVSLISHKSGSKSGKTTGKIHFDLSQFAGVPSATAPHMFQVNAKTQVHATITCTFVRISRGTASSIGSGMSGMTVSSGEYDGHKDDDFGDLDDLPTADVLDPDTISSSVSPKSELPFRTDSEFAESASIPRSGTPDSPPIDRQYTGRSSIATPSSETKALKSKTSRKKSEKHSKVSRSKLAALEGEVEKLQHELADSHKDTEKSRVLQQMSEDIIRELREKIESNDGGKSKSKSGAAREKELDEKVQSLKKKIATESIDSRQMGEKYEERILTLNRQVATMEHAKHRLESENKAAQEQLASLQAVADSKGSSSENSKSHVEAREKLQAEVSRLRDTNEKSRVELDQRKALIESLEKGCSEMQTETNRMYAKLQAHEEHATQVKSTYEELSKMYSELGEQNAKLSADLMSARIAEKSHPQSPKLPRAGSSSKSRKLLRKKSSKSTHQSSKDVTELDLSAEREERDKERDKENAALQAELMEKRRLQVDSERAKNDAEKQVASLHVDLKAANRKNALSVKEVQQLTMSLETAKDKHLRTTEQFEAVAQELSERKSEVEAVKQKHRQELQDLRTEKGEEIRKLRQAAVDAATAALDDSSTNDRLGVLEEALADATKREDQYEEEILNMTKMMDGLSNLVKEAQAQAEAKQVEDALLSGKSIHDLNLKGASAAAIIASETVEGTAEDETTQTMGPCPNCAKLNNLPGTGIEKTERQKDEKNDKDSDSQGSVRGGFSRFLSRKNVSKQPIEREEIEQDTFISSSNIRKLDLIEKITDGRLLNMLVETKMKLAIAEEERVRVID